MTLITFNVRGLANVHTGNANFNFNFNVNSNPDEMHTIQNCKVGAKASNATQRIPLHA